MRRDRIFTVLSIITVIASVYGCGGKKTTKETIYGEVKKGLYTNDYFGFTMNIPSGWESRIRRDNDIVHENPGDRKYEFDPSDVQTATLLYINREGDGSYRGIPNLQVVAENLSGTNINSGKQYLGNVMAITGNMGYINTGSGYNSISNNRLGGKDFNSADFVVEVNGTPVKQKMYVTVKNNFAITYILTYLDDRQLESLEGIMSSLVYE